MTLLHSLGTCLCICLMVPVAQGQELSGDAAGLIDKLPQKQLKKLQKYPGRVVEEVTDLIVNFGNGKGVDAAGIERSIAADRAAVRSREVQRLAQGDLDNDGNVDSGELAVLVRAGSGYGRARLTLSHRTADADQDGVVAAAELSGFAEARAWDQVGEVATLARRAVIIFDLDGDGWVRIDEVLRAADAVAAVAARAATEKTGTAAHVSGRKDI